MGASLSLVRLRAFTAVIVTTLVLSTANPGATPPTPVATQSQSAATQSQSAPLARELAMLMANRHLEAFAVKSPDNPKGFIARLSIPNIELLVIAAEPTVPDYVAIQLGKSEYRDVYALLHQASVDESKVYVTDIKADGLQLNPGEGADTVSEHGKR